MSSRIVKFACAAALAMPLVGAVGATSAHADDCHQPYGAIQGGSSDDATCNQVGLHLRGPRERRASSNTPYNVTSAASDGATMVNAVCDAGGTNTDFTDTAVDVRHTGAPGDSTVLAAITTASGRIIGYSDILTGVGDELIVTCIDDHRPPSP
jgi:hypothetical protein